MSFGLDPNKASSDLSGATEVFSGCRVAMWARDGQAITTLTAPKDALASLGIAMPQRGVTFDGVPLFLDPARGRLGGSSFIQGGREQVILDMEHSTDLALRTLHALADRGYSGPCTVEVLERQYEEPTSDCPPTFTRSELNEILADSDVVSTREKLGRRIFVIETSGPNGALQLLDAITQDDRSTKPATEADIIDISPSSFSGPSALSVRRMARALDGRDTSGGDIESIFRRELLTALSQSPLNLNMSLLSTLRLVSDGKPASLETGCQLVQSWIQNGTVESGTTNAFLKSLDSTPM